MGIGRRKLIPSGGHVFFHFQEQTIVWGLDNYYWYHPGVSAVALSRQMK